jgi:segregation and condensation protein B
MTDLELIAALEAIVYAADEPATLDQLAAVLGEDKLPVKAALEQLIASYASDDRGIEVRAVAGGYKLYTKPQHHDVVRRFIKSLRPPLRLWRHLHAPRQEAHHHRRPQGSHRPTHPL